MAPQHSIVGDALCVAGPLISFNIDASRALSGSSGLMKICSPSFCEWFDFMVQLSVLERLFSGVSTNWRCVCKLPSRPYLNSSYAGKRRDIEC